jgi:hypothetical protein
MNTGLWVLLFAFSLCLPLSLRYGPRAFLLALCALIPFPFPVTADTGGATAGSVSPADCFAAIMLLPTVFALRQKGGLSMGAVGWPLVTFLCVAALSSTLFGAGQGTAMSLGRMFLGTLVPLLIFANTDRRLTTAIACVDAFLLGTCILGCFSLYAFVAGGFRSSQGTLGFNKNLLGPMFGCGIAVALCFLLCGMPTHRRRLWLLFALGCSTIGIMFSLSRGAWIATASTGLYLLRRGNELCRRRVSGHLRHPIAIRSDGGDDGCVSPQSVARGRRWPAKEGRAA